ncbi:Hypothetical protein NTJ_02574 [Nesidiocoris tenuis]|uniref:Uncharacterized protein n=1 Tax=Nesidiocoris tenuis TaxID=355587 RepID=A0ABN7AHE4_9HEMI|nr:Hypothetical protein NTJ_02574 [Nesidiocoris tenuis]
MWMGLCHWVTFRSAYRELRTAYMSTPNKEKFNLKQNPSSEEACGLTSEIDLLKVGDSASDAGHETSESLVGRRMSFEGALAQSRQLGVIAPGEGSSCASGAGVTDVHASVAAAGGLGGPSGTHGSWVRLVPLAPELYRELEKCWWTTARPPVGMRHLCLRPRGGQALKAS